jgi:hypothetical protein
MADHDQAVIPTSADVLADRLFIVYGDDVRGPIKHDWKADASAILAALAERGYGVQPDAAYIEARLALHHQMARNHDYNPRGCSACEQAQIVDGDRHALAAQLQAGRKEPKE